jgi:hypothetical protein
MQHVAFAVSPGTAARLHARLTDPSSTRLHELARRDHRGVTEDGDQVTLNAG